MRFKALEMKTKKYDKTEFAFEVSENNLRA